MRISLGDPGYPRRLLELADPPPVLHTSGPLVQPALTVAIAGSRTACKEALTFAFDLAYGLAERGVLVVSGGALGVDGQAHRGAMAGGGATWVMAPTGRKHARPKEHIELFASIAASPTSRMIWPFADEVDSAYLRRNPFLVAVADAVVIISARRDSGSRSTSRHARALGRRHFVVPGSPWVYEFMGAVDELREGAFPLYDANDLFHALGLPLSRPGAEGKTPVVVEPLPKVSRSRRRTPNEQQKKRSGPRQLDAFEPPPEAALSDEENQVYSILSVDPVHRESIVQKSALDLSSTVTALLTLSLKDVVVEGPDGFFRRRQAR